MATSYSLSSSFSVEWAAFFWATFAIPTPAAIATPAATAAAATVPDGLDTGAD